MGFLPKDAVRRLEVAFQDEDHEEGAAILSSIVDALDAGTHPRADIAERVSTLVRHLMVHFQREEQAMLRSHFPPARVHTTEHWRVLADVRGQLEAWSQGGSDASLATYFRGPFVTWYLHHIESMDTATARWLAVHDGASAEGGEAG